MDYRVDWVRLRQEVRFSFAASSGPGGQNVNKTHTKAVLHWSPELSVSMSPEARQLVLSDPRIRARMSRSGEVVISVQTSRSQEDNKEESFAKLRSLLESALAPRKKRRKTRPTAGSRERRLEGKKRQSWKKAQRKVRERE